MGRQTRRIVGYVGQAKPRTQQRTKQMRYAPRLKNKLKPRFEVAPRPATPTRKLQAGKLQRNRRSSRDLEKRRNTDGGAKTINQNTLLPQRDYAQINIISWKIGGLEARGAADVFVHSQMDMSWCLYGLRAASRETWSLDSNSWRRITLGSHRRKSETNHISTPSTQACTCRAKHLVLGGTQQCHNQSGSHGNLWSTQLNLRYGSDRYRENHAVH